MAKPTKTKHGLFSAAILLCILLLCLLGRHQLLQVIGDHLVRDDQLAQPVPTAILLMGDEAGVRADRAVQLYAAHKIQHIVLVEDRALTFVKLGLQRGDAVVHADYLRLKGVAPGDVTILSNCTADSTLDEAHCLRTAVAADAVPPRELVVVTSWYHSARAGWLFERVFAETGIKIDVAAAVSQTSLAYRWWERKEDFLAVFNEYLKQLYWFGKQPS